MELDCGVVLSHLLCYFSFRLRFLCLANREGEEDDSELENLKVKFEFGEKTNLYLLEMGVFGGYVTC